jgi:bacteriorhodopsin
MLVNSILLSILIQILTGGIDVWGLTIKLPTNYKIYNELLQIELGVQVIELIFYIWLVIKLKSLGNITIYRYMDWFITTPTMLLTLMIYLYHNDKEPLTVKEFITRYPRDIGLVFLLNALMLVFGLLSEYKVLSVPVAVTLGFIPFAYYFWFIYKKYLGSLQHPKTNIYLYFLVFWSLYGVMAYLPYEQKNIGYNILDLFAKNGFGILLVYLIWQKSKSANSSNQVY